MHFLSTFNDRVLSDHDILIRMQIKGLEGKIGFVLVTDIPHNLKNIRYQYIRLNSVVAIGKYILDVGILQEAGVEVEVFRLKDWV